MTRSFLLSGFQAVAPHPRPSPSAGWKLHSSGEKHGRRAELSQQEGTGLPEVEELVLVSRTCSDRGGLSCVSESAVPV